MLSKCHFVLLFYVSLVYGKKSFTMLIDTTQSMWEELVVIQRGIGSVVSIPNASANEIENYILVPLNDPAIGPPIVSRTPLGFLESIDNLRVHGGRECPEDTLAGIETALEVSLPQSHIFVYTDAYAKDNSKYTSIVNLCRSKGSQVTIFLSGSCSERKASGTNIYFHIAKSCYGTLFRLDPQGLWQTFKFMREMINEDWNEIVTHDTFKKYNHYQFSINPLTKGFLVAVYGDNPIIRMLDEESRNPMYNTVVDTENTLVMRLRPVVGNYTLAVEGKSTTLVTFFRSLELPIRYGFSTRIPKSIMETSSRPMPGWTNYIFIETSTAGSVSNLNLHSIILEVDGRKTGVLPLDTVDSASGLYMANAFFEPDHTYALYYSGEEPTSSKNISGSTKPFKPQRQISEHDMQWSQPTTKIIDGQNATPVQYHGNVTITCKVRGYPKPEIWWVDQDGEKLHSEDFLLEIPSTHISVATIINVVKDRIVYCVGKNSEGEHSDQMAINFTRQIGFEVLQTPKDETIEYGTEGRLFCEVDAYPRANTEWYHNDTLVESSDKFAIVPAENMLVIRNMTLEDTGEYGCEVKNEYEQRTFKAVVTISGLESPKMDMNTSDIFLKPGDWTELECMIINGLPIPQLSWQFISDTTDSASHENLPDGIYIDEGKLKISSAKLEHSGIYRCIADNIVGQDFRDVRITIQYAPEIKNDQPDKLNVKEGDNVELTCDVNAFPRATVHWEKSQGDVIVPFDTRHSTNDDNVHRFESLWKDSGNYHCIAENDVGRAEKTVTVNVLVAPYIQTPESKTVIAKVGDTVTLQCNVLFGNPAPSVKWEVVGASFRTPVSSRRHSTSSLELRNITRYHEGTYMCVADNEVGSDSIRISLKLQ